MEGLTSTRTGFCELSSACLRKEPGGISLDGFQNLKKCINKNIRQIFI